MRERERERERDLHHYTSDEDHDLVTIISPTHSSPIGQFTYNPKVFPISPMSRQFDWIVVFILHLDCNILS